MSSIYSKNLEIYNAKCFRDTITGAAKLNVYFTIGKTTEWANDAAPPQANTSIQSLYETWNNMIGGKRITGYDVVHCAPRFNWTSGTVYSMYDDAIDSLTLQTNANAYYVVTDEWKVYKCLYNNGGQPSIDKPTSTVTNATFTTFDNYTWKYMYTVAAADRLRFTTDDYIPISEASAAAVAENAKKGTVSAIVVTNPGSGYLLEDAYCTVSGDGQNANAFPLYTDNKEIAHIVVDNPGFNYSYANIVIRSNTNTGANAAGRCIISPPGGHSSDAIEELGAGYLIINTQLKADENGKLIDTNDYRQIAIIESPVLYRTTELAANTSFNQTFIMTLAGISASYIQDEVVYQGSSLGAATFSAVVADFDSANSKIKLTNPRGTPRNDSLIGVTSTARRYVNAIINPDFEPYSGKLLYKDNILPVERGSDQTDSFQIILKF